MTSLVGSFQPLTMSLPNYPISNLGNTSTGKEAIETLMHPEDLIQTGILMDAQVYKETVMGHEG